MKRRLIVEHRSLNGPIREWWTEDDLIALSPVSLHFSLKSEPGAEQLKAVEQYARSCASRYLDVETGIAKMTEVPSSSQLDPRKHVVVDLGGGMMTAILLRTGRHLVELYPQGKVVTLIAWFDSPLIAVGDAEVVFLGCPTG